MKIKNFFILVGLLILITGCTDSNIQSTTAYSGGNEELQKITDSLTNYYRTQKNISEGGFLVKISSPSGDYLVSSGITPEVQDNSHFRIASITKTFTAAAIMMLHGQGKINIYDNISENMPGTDTPYLPTDGNYDVPFKKSITIEMLLGHRAGVFDVTNSPIPDTVNQPYSGMSYPTYVMDVQGQKYHTFTFDELVGVVAANNLYYFEPGKDFHYSNTGYNILGKIIERTSGDSYSDFILWKFLNVLAMTGTSSVWKGTDITIPSPYIKSFFNENGTVTNTTKDNMSVNVSEGNIISSIYDITWWIKLLLTGRAGISMEMVKKMMVMKPADEAHGVYGLGLTYTEGLGYGHNGAHISNLNILRYNPENGIMILVSANFWSYPDILEQLEGMTAFALNAVKIVQSN